MCINVQQLIGLSYSLSEVSAFNSHGFKLNWLNERFELVISKPQQKSDAVESLPQRRLVEM